MIRYFRQIVAARRIELRSNLPLAVAINHFYCPSTLAVSVLTFALGNDADWWLFCRCRAAKNSDSNRERRGLHRVLFVSFFRCRAEGKRNCILELESLLIGTRRDVGPGPTFFC
jgi:hypothetical protein